MQKREIERIFLISEENVKKILKEMEVSPYFFVRQAYVGIETPGNEIRIRERIAEGEKSRYTITIKTPGGLDRLEQKIKISKKDFEEALAFSYHRTIEKKCCVVKYLSHEIILSFFKQPLLGCILAEVEFEKIDDAEKFIPPEWFGKEVTHEKEYRGRNLALLVQKN